MSKNKKKYNLPRRFWKIDPVTQIQPDEKTEYNRAQSKKELQDAIEEEMFDDLDDDGYGA